MANHVIGIDLGTTFSCVAVCKKGRVEVFENDSGSRTTPSYVAFTEHERIIGNEAKNHVSEDPTNTVFEAKRLIGRKFKDPEVQGDMKEWPFKVLNDNGDPKIEVTHMGLKEVYTPPQISAMVLEKMKEIAEEKLGEEVKRAVITVPAYFNDSQRQATKDAARIAGLSVMKLINEPTAAAIAFAVDKKDQGRKNVLVYDLGGGTFDVSVLTIDKGSIDVKAVNGDTHLGGSDFDQLMVEHFLNDIENKYGKNLRTDTHEHKRARLRLRQSCETAKKSLAKRVQATINIDSLFDGRDYRATITKAKFEEICDDLFQKTLIPVERALTDANLNKDQIDEIVLVGGSTKIPKIQQILQDFFDGKQLNKSINADEAVAYGAAIQAAVMEGDKDEAIAGIHLMDVTSLSYGTDVVGDIMDVLIPRNTPYPVTVTETYLNGYDDQREMLIQVLQGEFEFAKDATKLKEFQLTLPPMPRATCRVNVCFEIDENGILNVSATELSTGAAKKVMIQNIKGQYTEEQINQMIEAANRQRRRDLQNKARVVAKNALESFCFDLKRSLNGINAFPNASAQRKTLVRNKAEETLYWVSANPTATQQQIEEKTREIKAQKDSLTN